MLCSGTGIKAAGCGCENPAEHPDRPSAAGNLLRTFGVQPRDWGIAVVRTIHVVPAIAEEASGPSYSVKRLCAELVAQGQDVTLAALDWAPLVVSPPFLKAFSVGAGPRRLGRSPAMKRWLQEEVDSNPVVILHNHGMWQMNSVYPAWAAKKANAKLVVSPRGAFSTWAMANGSVLKQLFWPFIQLPALRSANCFHATAHAEYLDIRRLGFRQPVAIIPNGVDFPTVCDKCVASRRSLVFLGRVHKVKGLDMLLPAWRAVQEEFSDWDLKIAGPDDRGYLSEMMSLAERLGVKRVEFLGGVYGEEKWQLYRDADLFVLPTYSENFAMSVAEALAAGTPAIVTKGAPWAGLEKHRAGLWIDIGVEPLVLALRGLLAKPSIELHDMGSRGRQWMIEEFSWKRIGSQMAETYEWLTEEAVPPPPWVRLD